MVIANGVDLHRVNQLEWTKTRHVALGHIVGIRVIGLVTEVIGFVPVVENLSVRWVFFCVSWSDFLCGKFAS